MSEEPNVYSKKTLWGAWKEGHKAILGSLIPMTLLGAAVGLGAAVIVGAFTGGLGMGLIAPMVLGCAGGGALMGMHEFHNIGVVSGAVSSAQNQAEQRFKEYAGAKFKTLEAKIEALAEKLTGAKTEAAPDVQAAQRQEAAVAGAQAKYTTAAHAPQEAKGEALGAPYFLTVGLMGGLVGAAIGALLAASGLTHGLMEHLGVAGEVLGHGSAYIGTMAVTGLMGMTFGVSRNWHRAAFEQTETMFDGELPKLLQGKGIALSPTVPEAGHPSPSVNVSSCRGCAKPKERVVFAGHQAISCQAHVLSGNARQYGIDLDKLDTRGMSMN